MKIDVKLQDTIIANLQRLRGDKTLAAFADEISTPEWKCYPATIQQIESRQHMPNSVLIMRLVAGLGLTPNDLMLPHRGSPNTKRLPVQRRNGRLSKTG